MQTASQDLSVVSVSGPAPVRVDLGDREELTVGRLDHHDVVLEHPEVSRNHARLHCVLEGEACRWYLTDLDSRHGTRLNGIRLEAGRPYPIQAGDLIDVEPWTLRVQDRRGPAPSELRLRTRDDATMVSTLSAVPEQERMAREQLRLLLECAESIQRATDENELAAAVLDAAVAGTGFANAAMLRPLGPDGTVDLVAARGQISAGGGDPRLSRSLIRKAAEGLPAQLGAESFPVGEAVSIVSLNIEEAICVPLMLGTTAAGFLYLDRRGMAPSRGFDVRDASAFAVGLGRLAALALADLKRQELAVRHARVEGELAAAAVAQQWILPRREGRIGDVAWCGECRPGRGISGDFFDVIRLREGRVAFSLGDVAGKGVPASVLMTTAQGFLNAALREGRHPSKAVRDLNEFLNERSEVGKFLTLWVGVIDPAAGTLLYVNAGHGYALGLTPDGELVPLDTLSGPVVGVDAEADYDPVTVPMPPGTRVVLVSDGIVEQMRRLPDGRHEQFGHDQVKRCLAELGPGVDEVEALYAAVTGWASVQQLADDATVVVIRRD